MPDFDVIAFPEADAPAVGDEAPGFTRPLVTDEYWVDVPLDDLVDDDPVALVFYPMNGGGRSIYTWTEITDRGWDRYATVVGVNIATPYDHARFKAAHDVPYGLYSDPGNGVAESYGVTHDLDGMTGVQEPRLSAFVLDGDRRVTWSWVSAEWPEALPYDAVEDELESLA